MSARNRSNPEENWIFEPEDWEVDHVETSCCICGVPSVENLVNCTGENCPIVCYHKQCVGLSVNHAVASEWMCEFCSNSSWIAANVDLGGSETKDDDAPRPTEAEATTSKTVNNPSVQDKKTNTKVKCKPFHQKDAVIRQASSLLVDILTSIDDDPFYKDSSISTFARMAVRDGSTCSPFDECSQKLVAMVCDCVSAGEGHAVGQMANNQIFREFHKMRSGAEVMSVWQMYLDNQSLGGDMQMRRKVLQIVLRLILQKVLQLYAGKPQEEDYAPFTMTSEEEGVLRLVVGYIPFALQKRYAKSRSPLAQQFKDVLQSWKVEEDESTEAGSFLAYTSVWLTLQNRGGLFKVSDMTYRFFRAVEKVVRQELKMWKIVNSDVSPKDSLCVAIQSDPTVQTCWERLICDQLTGENAHDLFMSVVNYYVKIRMTNFVRLYVNLKKKEQNTASRKGNKGLRKQLKKSSKK